MSHRGEKLVGSEGPWDQPIGGSGRAARDGVAPSAKNMPTTSAPPNAITRRDGSRPPCERRTPMPSESAPPATTLEGGDRIWAAWGTRTSFEGLGSARRTPGWVPKVLVRTHEWRVTG